MRQYEMMIILDPDLEERTIVPSLEKFLTVVTKDGGSVENLDFWGKRRLAYEIKKKAEGYYAVVSMTTAPEHALELDRQLGLNESILRTKLLRANTLGARAVARAAKAKAKAEAVAAKPAAPAEA